MSEPTKETHVCIGMFRPPWPEIRDREREIIGLGCVCGAKFACAYMEQYDKLHEHYLKGCFDEPVYATKDEILARYTGTALDTGLPE
jgi:hypothetical protein